MLMFGFVICIISQATSCQESSDLTVSDSPKTEVIVSKTLNFSTVKSSGKLFLPGKIGNNSSRLSNGLLYEFLTGWQRCTDNQGYVEMTAYVENMTGSTKYNVNMSVFLQEKLDMVSSELLQTGGWIYKDIYGNVLGRDFNWNVGTLETGEGRLINFTIKWPTNRWSGGIEQLVGLHITSVDGIVGFCDRNLTNILRGDSPDCPNNWDVYPGNCN
jgi:hypothetical protein